MKQTKEKQKMLKRSSGVVGPSCSAAVAVKSRKWREKRIAEDNMGDAEDQQLACIVCCGTFSRSKEQWVTCQERGSLAHEDCDVWCCIE